MNRKKLLFWLVTLAGAVTIINKYPYPEYVSKTAYTLLWVCLILQLLEGAYFDGK